MKSLLCALAFCGSCLAQGAIPSNADTSGRLPMSALPSGIGAQVPSGMIMLTLSSACPTGFTEVAALNGKFVQGTLAANSNVGTTGGSASITPTATSTTPAFTGTTNQSDSAVSAGTPAGTNSTTSATPAGTVAWPGSVPTNASTTTGSTSAGTPAGTISAISASATAALTTAASSGQSTANNSHTHPAPTFTGSAMSTHSHSVPAEVISWPVAVPLFTGASLTIPAETWSGSALGTHQHQFTATGTISTPSITVNAINPAPPNVLVIFCSKN